MAVGVGEDDGAALSDEVGSGVEAGGVFLYLIFPFDLGVGQSESFGGVLDAVDVGEGVSFGFIADEDHAYLEVGIRAAAGKQNGHGADQRQCQQSGSNFLEHFFVPPKFLKKWVDGRNIITPLARENERYWFPGLVPIALF